MLLQLYHTLAGAIHALTFGGSLGGVVQIRPGTTVSSVGLIVALGLHTDP